MKLPHFLKCDWGKWSLPILIDRNNEWPHYLTFLQYARCNNEYYSKTNIKTYQETELSKTTPAYYITEIKINK